MIAADSNVIDNPACPRCRYDLRGAVAAWGTQCEIDGTCPECGFGFAWADVLRRDRQLDRSFIEHTERRWRIPVAAVRTWWKALVPWRFWSWVKMHHAIRIRRIGLWLVLLLLPLWVLHGGLLALQESWLVYRWTHPAAAGTPGAVGGTWAWPSLTPLSWINCWLLPFVYIDDQPGLVPSLGWSNSASGLIFPGSLWAYSLRALCAFHLMWLVMVLVIPTTRARARVHRAHVLRAFVYGLAWTPLVVLVPIGVRLHALSQQTTNAGWGWGWGWWSTAELLDTWPLKQFMWLLMGWTGMWWYVVIVRHWRIERGRTVWAVLLVSTLLAAWIASLRILPYY